MKARKVSTVIMLILLMMVFGDEMLDVGGGVGSVEEKAGERIGDDGVVIEEEIMEGGGERVRDLSEHPWPMFQHDARHTGYNPNAVYDNPGRLKWRCRVNERIAESSPVIDSMGNIYVGSVGVKESGEEGDSGLYAIDQEGRIKWCVSLDWVWSSPAVFSFNEKTIIYVSTRDGKIWSIFANGTTVWWYDFTKRSAGSSLTIDNNGIIYLSRTDAFLYAIYPNGTLKWKIRLGVNLLGSTPAIGQDGTIYVGSDDTYLYAIYPNGTLKWKFKTGDSIYASSPAIASDGTVYIGSDDTYLYAIYPNGPLKWRFKTGGVIKGSPSISADGVVYFGSTDTYVYALYPNGTLKWKYKTGWYLYSSPAIDDEGNVYVGGFDGYLYCFGAVAPSEPVGVSAESGDGYVEVRWGKPEDDGGAEIEGYRVYRREVSGSGDGGNFTLLADVGSDVYRYRDEDVVNGWRYEYYVVAYNREGEGNSSEVVMGVAKSRQ